MKLSKPQRDLVSLLQASWELHYLHVGTDPGPYMTLGDGKTKQSKNIHTGVFRALIKKKVIRCVEMEGHHSLWSLS